MRVGRYDTVTGEFLRFLVVGGAGTVLNMAIFISCTDLFGVHYVLSAVIAFACAATSNYYWNRRWTFKWGGRPGIAVQFCQFFAISLLALGVNVLILRALVELLSVNTKLAQLAGIAAGTLCNFVGNKVWVFSKRRRRSAS